MRFNFENDRSAVATVTGMSDTIARQCTPHQRWMSQIDDPQSASHYHDVLLDSHVVLLALTIVAILLYTSNITDT